MFFINTLRKFLTPHGHVIHKVEVRENKYLKFSNWEYQKTVVRPHLPKNGIILDLGSGHNPVPEATILADFFPEDTIHRAGTMIEDKPLIVCSVDRLPFLDKKIDFVICSHIVEHVDSPIRAGNELARVAKAGYIETPAYGKDIIVGTGNMHNWQVVEFEGTMHFFEYSNRQREAHTTSPAMQLWSSKKYHPWQDFFWDRMDLFNAMHIWTGSPSIVEYRRGTSQTMPLSQWSSIDEQQLSSSPSSLTDKEIALLETILSTPDGKEPMKFFQGRFINPNGKISYPVRGKRIYFEMASN